MDGVLGSFECISACTSPTADERILALEANGDYNEALPLYAQSVRNKEVFATVFAHLLDSKDHSF